LGKFPLKWENSLKNENCSFIVGHVAFNKRESFLQILIKMGKFP
jgi:hypothetical protein